MAAPTNTATTLTTKGIREDLEDTIYRVAPEKTPFSSSIGDAKATNTYHEWQTEVLDTPSASNAALEGGDVGTLGAEDVTTRLGNYCQIFRKVGIVSGTDEVVKKAGRASEINRQKVIKGMPELMQKSMQLSQQRAMALMPEFKTIGQTYGERIQEACKNAPADAPASPKT